MTRGFYVLSQWEVKKRLAFPVTGTVKSGIQWWDEYDYASDYPNLSHLAFRDAVRNRLRRQDADVGRGHTEPGTRRFFSVTIF